jgi:protein-S-isoprenylcysteine O-methyltransferase Ste14
VTEELVFRILTALSGIAILGIRVYYQGRILQDEKRTKITGSAWRVIPGAVAALATMVFGAAYVFFPAAFPWSYAEYPEWLRWAGAAMALAGILLLWSAHHHLGLSFHSLVVRKSDQRFVQTGPYRLIRHPIYTAYMLSYLGGGLLASNLVLTFVACPMFVLLVALRTDEEESAMVSQFGREYVDYMSRTGRFLPPPRSVLRSERK